MNDIDKWTDWDAKVGTYAVVNVNAWGAEYFLATVWSQVGWRSASMLVNTSLVRKYFGYLAKDHGGHFQTVRAFSNNYIGIFEPYDERDYVSNRAATAGPHNVPADKLLAASMANHGQIGM